MIGTCGVMLWQFVAKGMVTNQKDTPISYSDLLNRAEEGKIKDVVVEGPNAVGHFSNGDQFHAILPPNDQSDMDKTLRAHGVGITYRDQNSNFWISTLISIAPFALL